jgi:hypothetical protein
MKKLVLVALLGGLTGCFHLKYVVGDQPATPPTPTEEEWHHVIAFGLAEISDPVNVSQVCPGGFQSAASEETFVNGLVHLLTASIYTPQTVSVTCAPGGRTDQSPNRPWK